MKRILCLFLMFLLVGCAQEETEPVQTEEQDTEQEEQETQSERENEEDNGVSEEDNQEASGSTNQQEDEGEAALSFDSAEELAAAAVNWLDSRDFETLSHHIHPEEGVRFSPYAYVDVDNDVVFTQEELRNIKNDSSTYLWGHWDGSGEPIEMTFDEYYERFIYDEEYVNAEEVGIDTRLGQGTTVDNSKEVYPDSKIIEYHFPGFEQEYEGLDWRSLRIVMETIDNQWYIKGFIHDEWTI
ncbi:hypothetical protein [Bacillus suaedae]|uniref:Uncharacterized protein n=1 Tax=Halalkalibacter suaedae TaxID=2822140 RepID=A0A940WRH2_9BACI|nr:hypothetical protein [Bacillus suaedae]MBP3950453.1 hypothetical protein [Bacillus suaedae]